MTEKKKKFSVVDHPLYKEAREIVKNWRGWLNDYRKENGLQISDVVAMSQGNDPYWMTTGKVLKGFWARNIVDTIVKPFLRANNISNMHLRDIHYSLLSSGTRTWSGEPYLNTNKHWGELIEAFANARYLGIVDWQLIRDNKNDFHSNTSYNRGRSFDHALEMVYDNFTPETIAQKLIHRPFTSMLNPWRWMPVHVEIWAEKDLAIMEQVCYEWDINMIVGEGEISITQVYLAADRIIEAGKPARIGYVSDCDVVGSNMVKAMARKLEFILRSQMGYEDADVRVVPLMATPEQVTALGLPTEPMKRSSQAYETRKDEWMETRNMTGAVEINSLHAQYPAYFRDKLEDFIRSYIDTDKWNEVVALRKEIPTWVQDKLDLDMIDVSSLENMMDEVDWDDVKEEFKQKIEDLGNSELDYSDDDEYYWWVLDTTKPYGSQLNTYRQYDRGFLTEGSNDD